MGNNIVIVGGGCSGLTASIYLARAGYNVKVLCGNDYGSLANADIVENFPGFPNGINGLELMCAMREQAKKCGAELIVSNAIAINAFANTVFDDYNNSYIYNGLIIATGSNPVKIEKVNAEKYEQKGIYYCATCDGPLYKNKVVGVVGGGDTALSEAIYLSNICKKVYMFVRRNEFRGAKKLSDEIANNHNISVKFNTEICDCYGDKVLKGVTVKNNIINKKENLDLDALFIAIGSKPNDLLIRSTFGEKFSNKFIGNVAICGDCHKNPYRQAVVACADGVMAAEYIEKIC